MCGIFGIIDPAEPRLAEIMRTLRDSMTARGPDGDGEFLADGLAMGMRRLSVIDLEGGWQPLHSAQGAVSAFQNGEIYNYRQLRAELESRGFAFQSKSDTEVLAHGYVCWGLEGLLERIDGMYAIAIHDGRDRRLHLARDRFGEKPLYFCHGAGRFAYSSNLLTLLALDWVRDDVDEHALDQYLAIHFVSGSRTLFRDISKLQPGECLSVDVDDPVPIRHRYYRPALEQPQTADDDRLADTIQEAVVSRLVADVPVGVFLSGGLDSAVVAAVAAAHHPGIDTFSMGFSDASHDERPFAEQMARHVGSKHHHFCFRFDEFVELLPQVVQALDEPIGDQALLPTYWLCREARKHVTVVLSGEGADEVFAGYDYYRPFLQNRRWKDRLKAILGRAASPAQAPSRLAHNAAPITPSGFPILTDAVQRFELTGRNADGPDRWEQDLIDWLDRAGDPLQRATAADIATWLPDDLLVKFDRMAMAHSLEGRAPYLAPRVVEAGLGLCQADRMDRRTSKVTLRRVARRWLPEAILRRPKQGFVLPMKRWLDQWFSQCGPPGGYFAEAAIPGLDARAAAALVERDLARGVQRERLLMALLLLAEWFKSIRLRKQDLRRRLGEQTSPGLSGCSPAGWRANRGACSGDRS
ncbi:MAG: asparagine synthase (glutamine-hydrolyzing) [Pirellulales bacterium]